MEPCQEYEALISAAVDGEVTEEERRALMEHLSRCESCREAYTQSLLLHEAFDQWEEEAPQGLAEAVMEQVRREPRQKKTSRSRRRWISLAAAAACLVLIVVGFQVGNTMKPAAVLPEDEDAALSDGGDVPSPASAGSQNQPDAADSLQPEEVQDPEPKVGGAVTQYETGNEKELQPEGQEDPVENKPPRMQEDSPQITAFAAAGVPVMTVTCADAGLLTWMAENIPQAGQTADGETKWVISAADWMKLEAWLAESGCGYETAGEKTSAEIVEGDLVEIICQAEPDA